MADEVVIKISGDNKDFKSSLNDSAESTKQFNESLKTIGIAAGVAFGGLVAGVYKSVEAYAEAEKSGKALNLALQNQGIYSEELVKKYDDIASAIERKTGIDDDDVKGMFASVQAMIGQKEITKEMAGAITDLAAARNIDLKSAGEMIAKGINGQTGALEKLGIQIDDHISKEERTKQILDQVSGKWDGLAESQNTGLGSIKGLTTAMGGLGEEVGARFAPLIVGATKALTDFIYWIKENPEIVDFGVKVIAAGVAITGLIAGVAAAITIFGQIGAAIGVVTAAVSGLTVGMGVLVGATGIGALLVIGALVMSNWKEIFPTMQSIFEAFVNNVSALAEALGTMFKGVFTLDTDLIEQGYNDAKKVIETGLTDFQTLKNEKMAATAAQETKYQGSQIASLKVHADKMQAENDKRDADELAKFQKTKDDKLAKEEAANISFLFQKIKSGGELTQAEVDKYGLDEANIEAHFQEIQGLTDTNDAALLTKVDAFNATDGAKLTKHLGDKQLIRNAYALDEKTITDTNNLNTEAAINTSYLNILGSQAAYHTSKKASTETFNDTASKANKDFTDSLVSVSKTGFTNQITNLNSYHTEARGITATFYSSELLKAGNFVRDMQNTLNQATTATSSGGGTTVAPVPEFTSSGTGSSGPRTPGYSGERLSSSSVSVSIGFDGKEASQVLTARQIEDAALGISQTVTV